MRSPDPIMRAPLAPLLAKELWEILGGRALWLLLLLVCPLVGYSFVQAVSLYGEASAAGLQSPALAVSLSPLDGVLVPTFGAFYVAVTLLFPFVAIRVLGHEKETGALRLLVQLPYGSGTIVAVKLAAVLAAWALASIPVLSALVAWRLLGGHLHAPETSTLVLGHLLYGLLVGAIALFAAAIAESAATAAIITLAFTLGSWVLDFTLAGRPGILDWLSRLSLTQVLRPFEQGLLPAGAVVGTVAVICGFAALAAIWLPPGVPLRRKLARSGLCVLAVMAVVGLASQLRFSPDTSEDRRNSFSAADHTALARLTGSLAITVHLAPEDPRYIDFRRNVLAKLERALPNVAVRLAQGRQTAAGSSADDAYGEIEYAYGARADVSRSTSPREVLPLLYALGDVAVPTPAPGTDYPGYPLAVDAGVTLPWFFGVLPLLIAFAWWWSRRPPAIEKAWVHQGGQ